MQGADLELGPRVPPLRPSLRRRLGRSEEHTSELQSRLHLVCRLLLEKKKINHSSPPLSSTPVSPSTLAAQPSPFLPFDTPTTPHDGLARALRLSALRPPCHRAAYPTA